MWWVGALLVGLLTAVWVYAKTIAADETRTVFGVSHMSLLCKAAYLLRWSMPQVDQARFLLYPAGAAGAGPDAGIGVYETALAHTRGGNTTHRASTLIVAFSGGAINKIGIPRHEFRRTLSSSASASECDQLYVLDPTGMSMYAHGLAQFEQMLRDLTAGYARCVFVGNCMGATGALRFAHLLPGATSTVIAVNPEIAPALDSRRSFRVAALLQPGICTELPAVLQASVDSSLGRVRIHSSSWGPERAQCELLRCGTAVEVVAEPDGARCAACLQGCRSKRTARVVYSTCREHGMLGDVLRPSGGLITIIEEAVSFQVS